MKDAVNDQDILSRITGLTADSRKVEDGFLFAAFPGTATDGRLFIPQAIESGARYILAPTGTALTEDDAEKATLIEDKNPRLRFALLAAQFYPQRPEAVAAVTGTSGKTSTANFTAQLWNLLGHKAASIGTLGIVTPDSQSAAGLTTLAAEDLFRSLSALKDQGIDHAAMEASSIGIDQYRMHGLPLKSAAFTNLSRDHLDYHGDMESYFLCKARLFTELLPADGTAIICTDDEWGQRLYDMIKDHAGSVWTYGHTGGDIKLLEQKPHATGQRLIIELFSERHQIDLPLAGLFQGLNVLAAIGLVLGASPELKNNASRVINALPSLTSVAGRMESITGHPRGAGVIVDYAHKPGALESVLRSLKDHVEGRLICLFGCGGNRDSGKRPEMGNIAAQLSDKVIVTDDNPRHEDPTRIRQDIIAGIPQGTPYEDISDRAAAIRSAVSSLEDGDVLVIAGKGHEQGQTIAGVTHPFDDRAIARQAIQDLDKGA